MCQVGVSIHKHLNPRQTHIGLFWFALMSVYSFICAINLLVYASRWSNVTGPLMEIIHHTIELVGRQNSGEVKGFIWIYMSIWVNSGRAIGVWISLYKPNVQLVSKLSIWFHCSFLISSSVSPQYNSGMLTSYFMKQCFNGKTWASMLPKIHNRSNLLGLSCVLLVLAQSLKWAKEFSGFLKITVREMLHKITKSNVCLDTLGLTNISRAAAAAA